MAVFSRVEKHRPFSALLQSRSTLNGLDRTIRAFYAHLLVAAGYETNPHECVRKACPFESGFIVIARARDRMRFPARFQLVAAMNPCPCGYLGEPTGRCRCTPEQIQRYRNKLSGPLLDRIDLHLTVARETTSLNPPLASGDTTANAAALVADARERQLQRQGCANAFLDLPGVRAQCRLSDVDNTWLETACERMTLSLRAAHRLLKVARTLADLEQVECIERKHLAEALQYRPVGG